MFEDLEGSTAFAAARGDADWREVQHVHDQLVRGELEARHATDIVFLGDGYLVAFASSADALDAAVGIQRAMVGHRPLDRDQPLRARIGLHTGEVSRDDRGHLVGTAVHAASRITGKAAGGQIFVSQAVKDAAKTGAFSDRGLFWLRGFPDRWRLHELLWSDATGIQTGAATHLVGREDELADLRRLLEQAEAGQGRLALIGGEPGVGKTSLAEDVMAEATGRGALALTGHCYQMEAPPYIPFVETLEAAADALPLDTFRGVLSGGAAEVARLWPGLHRIVPDLPPPLSLPPEQARRYLFTCLAEAIDRLSRLRPSVMLLDDLQWADPSTLLFLQHLTQQLGDVPLLLLGTYRDTELEPGRPFTGALETLIRQPVVERLTLRRLQRDAVARVLDGLADREPPSRLVDLVYSETEGNPFFVEEVFHHLAEEGKLFDANGDWRNDVALDESDVPQGVRLLLDRRLARLTAATRGILATAAVAGRGVGLRLLQHLEPHANGELLDALDEAERAHLVTFTAQGRDTAIHFSHELIRQTLIAELPTLRRQRMHARVADELEGFNAEAGEQSPYAADLSYHLLQAGPLVDTARTIHQLRLAGEQDIEAAAFEDALRRFELALSLDPADPQTRADLEFGLGKALRSLGRWDEAVERWKRAIDAYGRLGEGESAGQVSWYAAEQLTWIARWDEALVVAGEGLAALGDVVNADRVRLSANVAVMFSAGGYKEAADQMFAEAESLAGDVADPGLLGYVLNLLTVHHYFYGLASAAVRVGLRGADLLRAAGDSWNLANVLSFVALTAAFMLDFEQTHAAATEAEELAERLGHLPARWLAHRASWLEVQTGDLELFERFCERDLELIRGLPWTSGASMFASQVAFRRGRWDEAIRHIEEALEQEVSEALRVGDVAVLVLALAYAGDEDRALRLYAGEAAGLTGIGESATIGAAIMMTAAVEALWLLGEKEEAARHYAAIVAYRADTGTAVRTWDARLMDTLAGIAAAAGRDWETADHHFMAAIDLADRMPHLVEQADARRFHALMLLDRARPGDRERARELLVDAAGRYGRLGMPRHERMTEGLFAELR